MNCKDILYTVGAVAYEKSEQIVASGTCYLFLKTINWEDRLITLMFSVGASILSGYVVNRLKKRWDKPKKKRK